MTIPYTDISQVYYDGAWHDPQAGTEPVVNPATEEVIAAAPVASAQQVDAAIAALTLTWLTCTSSHRG